MFILPSFSYMFAHLFCTVTNNGDGESRKRNLCNGSVGNPGTCSIHVLIGLLACPCCWCHWLYSSCFFLATSSMPRHSLFIFWFDSLSSSSSLVLSLDSLLGCFSWIVSVADQWTTKNARPIAHFIRKKWTKPTGSESCRHRLVALFPTGWHVAAVERAARLVASPFFHALPHCPWPHN